MAQKEYCRSKDLVVCSDQCCNLQSMFVEILENPRSFFENKAEVFGYSSCVMLNFEENSRLDFWGEDFLRNFSFDI